jgi:HAD superfamily hydrolase (TIGR01549 family)
LQWKIDRRRRLIGNVILRRQMTTAVIFDLYGTLLNFPHDSRPFLQLAQRSFDVRVALETALTTDNPTLSHFASRIGIQHSTELQSLDAGLAADIAAIQPFEDVFSTLDEIKNRGIRTAVISNLATPYKQPFFEYRLETMIDVAIFSCDCGLMKPDPRIYERVLMALGATPTETIMVGDSLKSDVDGPSSAGIIGIHLVRSGGSSSGACVVPTLKAILEKAK